MINEISPTGQDSNPQQPSNSLSMLEFIAGAALGTAAGYLAKDKLTGANSQQSTLQREMNQLSDENEKLRQRHKEAERQVEDLLAKIDRMRRDAKNDEDKHDDLEDDLATAQRKIKTLTTQNETLAQQLKEYKEAYAAQEAELKQLKNA